MGVHPQFRGPVETRTTVGFDNGLMFVWGAAQRGVPMQVNVIGTAMFLIAIVIVIGSGVSRRKNAKVPA